MTKPTKKELEAETKLLAQKDELTPKQMEKEISRIIGIEVTYDKSRGGRGSFIFETSNNNVVTDAFNKMGFDRKIKTKAFIFSDMVGFDGKTIELTARPYVQKTLDTLEENISIIHRAIAVGNLFYKLTGDKAFNADIDMAKNIASVSYLYPDTGYGNVFQLNGMMKEFDLKEEASNVKKVLEKRHYNEASEIAGKVNKIIAGVSKENKINLKKVHVEIKSKKKDFNDVSINLPAETLMSLSNLSKKELGAFEKAGASSIGRKR